MTELAHGTIGLDLNDKDVIAGLRAVDSQFNHTMDEIERRKATAKIDADLRPLERQLERARRQLRELEGERATAAKLGADTAEFDTKIENAKREVRQLDGKRATVELRVEGAREFNRQLSESNNMLYQQERAIQRAAAAEKKRRYDSTVGIDKEVGKVVRLQQEYAKLTDKLEALDKKRPIGREERAKVELNATGVVARMEALKAELNFLGAHPPVDIKADLNRRGLDRIAHTFTSFLTNLGNKASGLSDLSVRMGPFTTSLRGLGLALGFLGPTITDVLGAAGSLVGVLGAGISGAAALGAGGIVGLGGAFLGLKFATRNTGQEIANARTAINAYQKQVEKTGASSDKAKTKLQEMNHVLASISPLAREAALGTEKFFTAWDKATGPTRNNLGKIAHDGFAALNELRPMWAARTNEMSGMLQKGLSKGFAWLGHGAGRNLLGGIFKDFNAQVPTLLHGLGQFGEAFLRFAREGARNLDVLVNGFDNLGTKINNFTQRDNFGSTVKRWVTYAQDVMRFFGAATRVLVHFFGDGSKAGDDFINTMTRALNRWDKFLTSTSGKNKMADFFHNSVKGTEQLYSALKPIIQLFALWATGLEPAVTVITSIATAITNAGAALGRMVGLGNPLKTLGMTLGAAFAISKIGGFVAMLARAVTLMKELGAVGTVRGILNGSFLSKLNMGQGIAAAGEEAALAMRAAIISGGTVAAAEMRAGVGGGGVGLPGVTRGVGTAEKVVATESGLLLPEAAVVTETASVGTLATAIAAMGGIAAVASTGGIALLGIGLAGLLASLGNNKTEVQKLTDRIKANNVTMRDDAKGVRLAANAQNANANSHKQAVASIKSLRAEMEKAAKGTVAYRDLQLKLYDARQKLKRSTDDGVAAAKRDGAAAKDEVKTANDTIAAIKKRTQARIDEYKHQPQSAGGAGRGAGPGTMGDPTQAAALRAKAVADIEAQGAREVAAAVKRITAARNAQAAATLNVSRAEHNMTALTGKNAQEAGALARQRPNLAQTIALKYASPTNVGDVSGVARRALGQGVSLKTVLHIIADSKDAEAALRRLRTAEVNKKMVKFGIEGHGGVLSKLSEIDRKSIRQKIANIIQHGGEPTLSMINNIIARQIRDKRFAITSAVSQAIAGIDLVASGLSRIQSKSIMISVHHLDTYGGKGHHASGLRLRGSTHDALIGEGGGPEWHVNTARMSAYKTRGPMVARVGPHDAIIPTEPAYRSRGRSIMHQIADDLGMHMYKASKRPKAGKTPKTVHPTSKQQKAAAGTPAKVGTPAAQKQAEALGVPKVFKSGGVDESVLSTELSSVHTALTSQQGKLDSAKKALFHAQKSYDAAAAKKDSKGKHVPVPAGTKNSLESARQTAFVYEHGGRLPGSGKSLPPLKDLQSEYNDLKTADNEAKHANQRITHLEQVIDTQRTKMATAATQYANTGDQKYKDTWTDLQTSRGKNITTVLGLLQTAASVADRLHKKYPHSIGLEQYADALHGDIATQTGNATDNTYDTAPTPPAAPTLDDFIKSLGKTDTLAGIVENVAIAGTTATTEDDVTYGTQLRDFYSDLLTTAQTMNEPAGIITEIATDLKSAQDALGTGSGPNANDQALVDQANTRATTAAAGQHIAEAALAAFTGPGDIGAGGSSAYAAVVGERRASAAMSPSSDPSGTWQTRSGADVGSGGSGGAAGPTIVINTLHPGDPATLRAVGEAATAGMGYQGFRDAPRESLGL